MQHVKSILLTISNLLTLEARKASKTKVVKDAAKATSRSKRQSTKAGVKAKEKMLN